MAEDTVDKAGVLGLLPLRKCMTRRFPIHGYREHPDLTNHLYVYGSDMPAIAELMRQGYDTKLVEGLDYTEAEVVWAVREEMARTVEDVLARRVRILFVDARRAVQAAPRVAQLLAAELGTTRCGNALRSSSSLALPNITTRRCDEPCRNTRNCATIEI